MSTQYNGNAGLVTAGNPVAIASSTNTNPIVVTTSGAHGMSTNDTVDIINHTVNTSANGINEVTVLSSTTFSIPVAGVGVGGATGLAVPLSLGATYQIPSDGDALNAASVNVGFETLGDRTARLAVMTGAFKLAIFQQFPHTGASQITQNFNTNISNASGWISLNTGSGWTVNGIVSGDYIEIDIRTNVQVAPDTVVGSVEYSIGAGISVPGIGPIFGKITGSGLTVPVPTGANGPITPIALYGIIPNVIQTGNLQIVIGGTADLATAHTIAMFGLGDYTTTVRVWRPNLQLQ